jgi:lysophospholipase L1-like esterase
MGVDRWLTVLAIACLGLGFATGQVQAEPEPPAAKEPKKRRYVVAAMGDSLTDPRSHGGKYLEHLRKRCPKSRFDSYGVGGNMVNQMRRRFVREIFPAKTKKKRAAKPTYTHLIVLGGINDICSDETAKRTNDKIEKDLAWMYAMGRERGLEVIALTLPPWAGFTRYYNRRRASSTFALNGWIKKQLANGKVDALLDVYPLLSCGRPEHLCDRFGWSDKVHWNKARHEVIGKALHSQVFSDCE